MVGSTGIINIVRIGYDSFLRQKVPIFVYRSSKWYHSVLVERKESVYLKKAISKSKQRKKLMNKYGISHFQERWINFKVNR